MKQLKKLSSTINRSAARQNHKLKAVDFFCGAGGMSYGLYQAGIQVLAGVDFDPDCKKTYEENIPGAFYLHRDIKKLEVDELSVLLDLTVRDDSLVFCGCSPCQYWTKINTNKQKSKQSKDLLLEFKKFIEYFLPGYIVIENVPGLFNKPVESGLDELIKTLDKLGYAWHHKIINSLHFNVPQNRRRYLLIASRVNDSIAHPPEAEIDGLTVRNFIGDESFFPPIPDGHKDSDDRIHTTMKMSDKNKRRIEVTPHDGGTRMSWKDDPNLQINAYKGKDNLFRDVYGRMFWDKPAPTITTRFNSLSNGRFGHPEQNRAISLLEGAVLQTFPISYKFLGNSENSIARQIGNAVPPELAKRIGEELIRSWQNASV